MEIAFVRADLRFVGIDLALFALEIAFVRTEIDLNTPEIDRVTSEIAFARIEIYLFIQEIIYKNAKKSFIFRHLPPQSLKSKSCRLVNRKKEKIQWS